MPTGLEISFRPSPVTRRPTVAPICFVTYHVYAERLGGPP